MACLCCSTLPRTSDMTPHERAFMAGAAYMLTNALREGAIQQLCERHGSMLASVLKGVHRGHEEAVEAERKAAS